MTRLGSLASVDLDAAVRLLIVPLGATEQHGPHLPLQTDTAIAEALARRLAEVRPHAVVAPALPYGSSGEHQAFPGTLPLGVVLDARRKYLAVTSWTCICLVR